MLCQRCNRNRATTILTQTVNGRTQTEHLCSECAYQNGLTSLFSGLTFHPIFQGLSSAVREPKKRCPQCGITLDEIVESGRIGCSECYHYFRTELMPTIQNIHGKATHVGKRPASVSQTVPMKPRIAQLRDDLQEAVQKEKYEEAAKLRDKIKELSQSEQAEAPKAEE